MLGIFEEMDHFTPRKRIAYRQTVHVTNLCNCYDLDPQIVKTDLHIAPCKTLCLYQKKYRCVSVTVFKKWKKKILFCKIILCNAVSLYNNKRIYRHHISPSKANFINYGALISSSAKFIILPVDKDLIPDD